MTLITPVSTAADACRQNDRIVATLHAFRAVVGPRGIFTPNTLHDVAALLGETPVEVQATLNAYREQCAD